MIAILARRQQRQARIARRIAKVARTPLVPRPGCGVCAIHAEALGVTQAWERHIAAEHGR